jgi:hypothetical protein
MDSATKQLFQNAVKHYWVTREKQSQRQKSGGRADQGTRSAVTGGAQMDGFIKAFTDFIIQQGIAEAAIYSKKSVTLPGFYRPTKEWDLLIVKHNSIIAAIEAKSQTGPSFGNNFNNRIEEALGSAVDLWQAYKEGAFQTSPQPFLGYLFLLEDCEASTRPVSVSEPHFKVFREFRDASYQKRYELFCRKLIRERQYTAAAFIVSNSVAGIDGTFMVPAEDLSPSRFLKTLASHISASL